MFIDGIKVQIGQQWITKDEEIVQISAYEEDCTGYPWKLIFPYSGETAGCLDEAGKYWHEDVVPHLKKLYKEGLVSDPSSQPQQETLSNPCVHGTYTEEQIREAFEQLKWSEDTLIKLVNKLKKLTDPEYVMYLKLKGKFENN